MIKYVRIVMLNSSKLIAEYLLIILDGVKKILNMMSVVERSLRKSYLLLLKKIA